MQHLDLFLPCAAGVQTLLAAEVARITGQPLAQIHAHRAGVALQASWRDALSLNLHSRLAQRVLLRLADAPYRDEHDLYELAHQVAWDVWLTPSHTIKVEVTAQHSPLKSLNFAALRVKDALCDRLRAKLGQRPSVDTAQPDVRIFVHLAAQQATLYIDTSGQPLFKRGWRQDQGDAPLKETLAAALLAAIGWGEGSDGEPPTQPLYDPCCGSGTIAIEAACKALNMAPGKGRRFGFEKLLPFQPHVWQALRQTALERERTPSATPPLIFGSDVSFRMVDFARRNAERAGVAHAIDWRGGDALQRMPPAAQGVLLLNPPYGDRLAAAGQAGQSAHARAQHAPSRETAQHANGDENAEFFLQLAQHWKKHYGHWTAWLLTPDLKLPGKMRLKESQRVPLWNGPIECRLFRFDILPPKEQGPTGLKIAPTV